MRTLFRKLGWLFGRRRLDTDLRDELEFHLAEEAEARQAAGASEEDARRQARRDLGQLPLIVEDTRAAWGWIGAEHLLQDLRSGSRIVTRSPAARASDREETADRGLRTFVTSTGPG